jgi:gamma-glutamyl hydrolase
MDKCRLFNSDPSQAKTMATKNITMNNHHWSVTPDAWAADKKLHKGMDICTTNMDVNGIEFVSSMQHKTLPIYAVQYHPEKNNFEPAILDNGQFYEAIHHSLDAVRMSQFHANFFVNECRKSRHRFASGADLNSKLIYNYQTTQSDLPSFVNTYPFQWKEEL